MTARHRRRRSTIGWTAAAAVLATVATYGTIALASPPRAAAQQAGPHALQDDFASAAREFDVPQSVLMAVSYRQTLWDSHGGLPSTTGSYNVMGLTQVDPGDLAGNSDPAGPAADGLNQSGDPARMKSFAPDKSLLTSAGSVNTADPRLHTLDQAAKLIHQPAAALRTDRAQSVRGAAALLAGYEKAAAGSLPADAGRWYAAVARYSQSPDTGGAQQFADRVYESISSGESRTTDDGQQVVLPASPGVHPVKTAKTPLAAGSAGTRAATPAATPKPECPTSLRCNFVPAAHKQNSSDKADYGNYDITNRPLPGQTGDGQKITSIVIHDTEGDYGSALTTFQNPKAEASTNYLIRASDGLVTQVVQDKDTAWHAGNKSVNMHSIGIEHEGYAIKSGHWYTEPQYESSALLVRYLTALYGIPRDREHIFGHDEVPGPLNSYVAGMHWDPGPFWDWNRYMALLNASTGWGGAGAPLRSGQVIRIVPPFTSANQPAVTYGGKPVAAQPADFVYLYTQPSTSSARLGDPYLHGGSAGTSDGPDWGDKAVAGTRYVVAQQSGDWTAIWYGGKKGWFYDPGGRMAAAVDTTGQNVVTPVAGRGTIAVFGRAYPETAAYAGTKVPVQADNDKALTSYTISAGQKYVPAGPAVAGDYFYAQNIDNSAPGDHTLVTGSVKFYPIRFNHRMAWVRSTDVQLTPSTARLPATSRYNVIGRDSSGTAWQYQGTTNPSAPFLSRFKIDTGWQAYNTATPTSVLRADGTGDVLARDTKGSLWYYQGSGNPVKPFKARVKVSTDDGAWGKYTWLAGVGDVNGDGHADLIARDSKGNLWLYKGTGTHTVLAFRASIGTGWNMHTALAGVGDITGDGKPDLVARDTTGKLWLYQGTGSGTAPWASRVQIGTGWNAYNSLVGVGDISGDGRPDLLARTSAGSLYLYKGTGSATAPWSAKAQVGSGWSMYGLLL
ncbi:N-acetylmuramoyl-L-alanine amidase [Streptomyces sp. CA-111067]|uniref:N-acetylmuramoyl-L-alanine amidase n=1 Tax=Streptomyces sp. CA-111067 TaxID=3240046 RepID=UPI003D96E52A